jgi:hypothetical protein
VLKGVPLVALGWASGDAEWVNSGWKDLVTRPESLSDEDVQLLGIEKSLAVVRIREKLLLAPKHCAGCRSSRFCSNSAILRETAQDVVESELVQQNLWVGDAPKLTQELNNMHVGKLHGLK